MDDFGNSGAIARLWHRLRAMIGRGRITLLDDSGAVQTAQLTLSAQELVDPIRRVAEYGFTSNPPIGTDAVVIFIGGDRSKGAIIATNHQASRLKNLQPGDAAIYDNRGRWVWLKSTGIEIEANGSPVDIKNATTLTAKASTKVRLETPLVEITGNVTVAGTTGLTVSGSGDVVAGGKSLRNHVHPGVTAGGANTGAPV